MLQNFLDTLVTSTNQLKAHLPITIGFVVLLFGIHILNFLLGYRLNILGIWPRKPWGLIGIPFSPFLHGDFSHLIFNSLPLFIFSNFILLQGLHLYLFVTVSVILLSGILVWLLGRPGIHVGASSLIMGYLGFITINAFLNPNVLSVIVILVTVIYFGGIFSNLLPSSEKQVSWEGHLLGFISGLITAYILTQPKLLALIPF